MPPETANESGVSPTRAKGSGSYRTRRTSRENKPDYDPCTIARFWSKVDVGADGSCWPWGGATTNGYGRFQNVRAHRYAYKIAKAAIPDDLMVRHLCGHKLCVNPHHLEVGTMKDNAADGIELGETLRGSKNGKAKIGETEAAYIITNPDNLSGRNLARKFGVSPATICLIQKGERWQHVHERLNA